MKKYYISVIICFLTVVGLAQSKNDIGKITLSIVMPTEIENVSKSNLGKLQNKIIQIITSNGISSEGLSNSFIVYPKFEINESNVVEGGLQKITVVNTTLILITKQIENNLVFSSTSSSLKGSGSNMETAIANAISKININNTEYKAFLESSKAKILNYYESNCKNILAKSDMYSKNLEYEKALSLLMGVPSEITSCSELVQAKSIEIYKLYNAKQCNILIMNSKSKLAENDIPAVLDLLKDIDPSSSCYNEANKIANSVLEKAAEQEKKEWEQQMQIYSDAVKLEQSRIDAIKDIAVAYCKSQPQTIKYNYIIK